jgi:hypothetical protein
MEGWEAALDMGEIWGDSVCARYAAARGGDQPPSPVRDTMDGGASRA